MAPDLFAALPPKLCDVKSGRIMGSAPVLSLPLLAAGFSEELHTRQSLRCFAKSAKNRRAPLAFMLFKRRAGVFRRGPSSFSAKARILEQNRGSSVLLVQFDLTADFTAGEICRVDVDIRVAGFDGLDEALEVAELNALRNHRVSARGGQQADIGSGEGSRDRARTGTGCRAKATT